jgi:tyrosyl-tRNA synthetase
MQGSNPRDIKFDFALEIVQRFHGRNAAQLAAREFIAKYRNHEVPSDMPEVSVRPSRGNAMAIAQVLKQAQLTSSTTEALRLVEQGGVKVDGEKITDKGLMLPTGKTCVIQVGKHKFARVTVTS